MFLPTPSPRFNFKHNFSYFVLGQPVSCAQAQAADIMAFEQGDSPRSSDRPELAAPDTTWGAPGAGQRQ